MLKDIFIIILVIVLSYIFTIRQNNKNKLFNPQLMFIVLSLSVIVIYKVLYYKNLTKQKEGFYDVGSEIVNFIESQGNDMVADRLATISENDRRQYIDTITDLSGRVATLNQRMEENSREGGVNENLGSNDTLSLETIQKMQNFQIDFLQKQIDKSKELLQQQEIEDSIKKYKPIKVYSSCNVSSADGAFTEDSIENTRSNQSNLTPNQIQSMGNMMNTISQTNSSNNNTNSPENNQNILANMLSSILNSQQTQVQLT